MRFCQPSIKLARSELERRKALGRVDLADEETVVGYGAHMLEMGASLERERFKAKERRKYERYEHADRLIKPLNDR